MDFSIRNKQNVESRWRKVHEKERAYIRDNKEKTKHFRARICGFLAGDGNLLIAGKNNKHHNTVRFFPDHHSLIKPYIEATLKVYNKKPKIIKKKNYYCLNIDSKPMVEDILSTTTLGTSTWSIPKSLKSNNEKIEWLRAFFDAEAYVHQKYIRVQSVNGEGLKEVKELLGDLNIYSKIYEYMPKQKNHKKVYMLTIIRKKDKLHYKSLIGFNHTTKLKKLNFTLQTR